MVEEHASRTRRQRSRTARPSKAPAVPPLHSVSNPETPSSELTADRRNPRSKVGRWQVREGLPKRDKSPTRKAEVRAGASGRKGSRRAGRSCCASLTYRPAATVPQAAEHRSVEQVSVCRCVRCGRHWPACPSRHVCLLMAVRLLPVAAGGVNLLTVPVSRVSVGGLAWCTVVESGSPLRVTDHTSASCCLRSALARLFRRCASHSRCATVPASGSLRAGGMLAVRKDRYVTSRSRGATVRIHVTIWDGDSELRQAG